MSNIYYFNINYYCNNNCVFCFSSSTGDNLNQITLDEFKRRIDKVSPRVDDKIIFNGGEPSIHPDFYLMLDYVHSKYKSKIVVYSNGVVLDISRIKFRNDILFIIPIHGETSLHDAITRRKKSFEDTLKNICQLQMGNVDYSIKFIINKTMVERSFDLFDFLVKYDLKPCEIVIARLNETKKAKNNNVLFAKNEQLMSYLKINNSKLWRKYSIKYLDIPFCYLGEIDFNSFKIPEKPTFFFNDYIIDMVNRDYYKEVMIGQACDSCNWHTLCRVLSNTYLTLSYSGGWIVESE